MIVLDTNVLSELMRPAPDDRVRAWATACPAVRQYTTSITQAEILHGVHLLSPGRRRTQLLHAAAALFADDFAGRVLAFGSDAAVLYARIVVDRRRAGRPIGHFAAQIAAIARACGAAVATRNQADFEGCGLGVVNPWVS